MSSSSESERFIYLDNLNFGLVWFNSTKNRSQHLMVEVSEENNLIWFGLV